MKFKFGILNVHYLELFIKNGQVQGHAHTHTHTHTQKKSNTLQN